MNEADVLDAIEGGSTAFELLLEADPKFNRRWNSLCRSMVSLLNDVQKHFPDAQYYTASGGFNLLLGDPHDENHRAQQQLIAFHGKYGVSVGDGDF